jgi:catechol 2,3-dioxygenase-like lactoylglutathione lyase family enzyme
MAETLLNLVVIRSPDLERSKRFYEALGLTLHKERHGNGPEHYSSQLGPTAFEIYPVPQRVDATLTPRLGFQVPSVDRTLALLQALGTPVVSEPMPSPWGRRAVVRDPDGRRVEITEPTAGKRPAP